MSFAVTNIKSLQYIVQRIESVFHISTSISYQRFLQFTESFEPHYGPVIHSVGNTNEYQKVLLRVKVRPVRKADNLADICEPIV
jgi:hypothetical protein